MFAQVHTHQAGGSSKTIWVDFTKALGAEAQFNPAGEIHQFRVFTVTGDSIVFGATEGAGDMRAAWEEYVASSAPPPETETPPARRGSHLEHETKPEHGHKSK